MTTLTQTNSLKKWAPDWLTFLSAVLIVASFPPWNLWPLLWVCLVPWFVVLKKSKTPREATLQGIWLGFFMTLGVSYWVGYVLQEFGNLPWLLSFIGLLIYCPFGHLQFPLFAWIFKKLEACELRPHENKIKSLFFALTLAFTYTGVDWLIPKLFMDTLGHALYLATYFRQVADLGGAGLLTFILFFFNYSVWMAFQELKEKRQVKLSPLLGIAVLICAMGWTYGFYRSHQVREAIAHAPRGIQGAAIQGNIGDFDKIAAERGVTGAANKVMDTFTRLTTEALHMHPRPDFIVWPETSYPSTFRTPHSLTEARLDQTLEDFSRSLDIPLLFGGYDHANGKDFNAFFFLASDGRLQTYRKNILLLFGEYIPGADSLRILKDAFPQVGNFGRGIGPEVLNITTTHPATGTVSIGPIICYEALFPNYIIEAARNGSELIMNITNDSWFGSWGEPQLHLALSTFRSIETHLPMLRTTNTGISALILPDGEITHPTELGVQKILNVYIPLIAPIPTLIKAWGDWFNSFCLGMAFLGISMMNLFRRKESKKSQSVVET